MISNSDAVVVLVTVPDIEVARRLAGAVLHARLAACANLLPGVESHYWWQGQLESSAEVLVVFKTIRSQLEDLERTVHTHHPYQVPEFVVLPITGGSEKYLGWIARETGSR
jgi:periplasmic divalent cation tolerance protein